jgi:hypothetical protein
MAYRLGWVLYWACLVLAGISAVFFLWLGVSDSGFEEVIRQSPYLAFVFAAPSYYSMGLVEPSGTCWPVISSVNAPLSTTMDR